MALSPELDALVVQITALENLLLKLNGTIPIVLTIGDASLTVDPAINADAYSAGNAVIRSVTETTLGQLRNAVASTVIAQSQATPPGPAQL